MKFKFKKRLLSAILLIIMVLVLLSFSINPIEIPGHTIVIQQKTIDFLNISYIEKDIGRELSTAKQYPQSADISDINRDGIDDVLICHEGNLADSGNGGCWYWESDVSKEDYYDTAINLIDNKGPDYREEERGYFADLNSDGYDDVYAGTATDIRIRYYNPHTGLFNTTLKIGDTKDENDFVAVGTADGDVSNGLDIFVNTDFNDNVWIITRNLSESDGYNQPKEVVKGLFGTDCMGAVTADLNGDSISDFIFGKYDDRFSGNYSRGYILLSDPDEADNYHNFTLEFFQSGGIYGVGEQNGNWLLLEGENELNGDGIADLIIPASDTVLLFLSNSSEADFYNDFIEILSPDERIKGGSEAKGFTSISAEYLNEDRNIDLITSHYKKNALYFIPGCGECDTYFGEIKKITDLKISEKGEYERVVYVVFPDVNHDGTKDWFWATFAETNNRLWLVDYIYEMIRGMLSSIDIIGEVTFEENISASHNLTEENISKI